MKRIIYLPMDTKYAAYDADHPAMWSVGATTEEAIGRLILTWPSEFNVEIEEAKRA